MASEAFRGAIDSAEAVAFDVFDTLIVRPFWRPKDLFRFIEAESKRDGFAKERIDAEKRARRTIRPEVDLDEIYSVMDKRFRDLKDSEISAEISFCRADSDALALFAYAKEKGKRIVIVSDMYLPSEVISKILEKNGYSGYDRLYVSNETGGSKHDGSMYDMVSKDLGLSDDKILMIGDNARSDTSVSRSKGMSACRWIPLRERYAAGHRKEAKYAAESLSASVLAGVDALQWQENVEPDNYWYQIGRRYGGPMAAAFTMFIRDHCPSDADLILFCSRDGYVPMKAYETLCGSKVPVSYYYTSRLLCKIFGDGNTDDPQDLEQAVVSFLRDTGRAKDIGMPDEFGSWKEQHSFMTQHRETIERILDEGRTRYLNYVHSITDGHVSIVLVDTTTMRYSAQKAISGYLKDRTKITGCYYAITKRSDLPCYAYHDRSREHITWSYVNLAEYLFSSNEAPIRDVGDDKKPVYLTHLSSDEKLRIDNCDDIHHGECDYIRFFKGLFDSRMPSIDGGSVDRWIKLLFGCEKHGDDRNKLSGTLWAIDTGNKEFRHLLFRPSESLFVLRTKMGKLFHRTFFN